MVALTTPEYRELIRTIKKGGEGFRPNPRVAAILTAEANLGMRVGDVLRLRMCDIVRDGGRWRLNMVEEKTGKKRRFTVPEAVYDFLRGYADSNGIPDDQRLFPVSPRAVQKHLKTVCDYLGLDNISTHSFRKWYATEIYNANGHDIALVQHLLQHSSPMITQRYIGVGDDKMEAAINGHVSII